MTADDRTRRMEMADRLDAETTHGMADLAFAAAVEIRAMQEEIERLRRERDAFAASARESEIEIFHASDCAVHNEPALPVADCDCGAAERVRRSLTDPIDDIAAKDWSPALAERDAEIERLKAGRALYWREGDPEIGFEDPQELFEYSDLVGGDVAEVLTGREYPGNKWIGAVCTALDNDGAPDDWDVEVFATREEAEEAWTRSVASLFPDPAAARAALQKEQGDG